MTDQRPTVPAPPPARLDEHQLWLMVRADDRVDTHLLSTASTPSGSLARASRRASSYGTTTNSRFISATRFWAQSRSLPGK